MVPGTAMIIPKNVVHWMRNDSDKPVEVVGIYPEVPNFSKTGQQVMEDWKKYGFEPRPAAQ